MEKPAVRCPGCGQKLVFEARHSGRKVACPSCRAEVLLALPIRRAEKHEPDVIEDPFAELADSAIASVTKSGDVKSGETFPVASVPKTAASAQRSARLSGRDAGQPSDSDSGPFENHSGDTSEEYIDELGLADLKELRPEQWSDSSTLPPVQRRLLRNAKHRGATGSDLATRSQKQAEVEEYFDDFKQPSNRQWMIYVIVVLILLLLGVVILRSRGGGQESEAGEVRGADAARDAATDENRNDGPADAESP